MCFTAGGVVSLEEGGTTMAKEERNTTLLRCATVLVCFLIPRIYMHSCNTYMKLFFFIYYLLCRIYVLVLIISIRRLTPSQD